MKLSEIKKYRQDLRNIVKIKYENQRRQELVQLTIDVGAGFVYSKIAGTTRTEDSIINTIDKISETELVLNINNALQTETMINALKTASLSWIVAVIALFISFGSFVISIVTAK
jgi:uncharacterized protein YueI